MKEEALRRGNVAAEVGSGRLVVGLELGRVLPPPSVVCFRSCFGWRLPRMDDRNHPSKGFIMLVRETRE